MSQVIIFLGDPACDLLLQLLVLFSHLLGSLYCFLQLGLVHTRLFLAAALLIVESDHRHLLLDGLQVVLHALVFVKEFAEYPFEGWVLPDVLLDCKHAEVCDRELFACDEWPQMVL